MNGDVEQRDTAAGGLRRFLRDVRVELGAAHGAMMLAAMPETDGADVEIRPAAVIDFTGDTEADALLAAGVWARTAMPPGAVIKAMTPAYTLPSRFGERPKFRMSVMISVPDQETGETDEPALVVEDSSAPIDPGART